MSYRTLMSDLAALYGGRQLPALGYTYRDYRQASAPGGTVESHRQWWSERIPELPDPPRLPLVPSAEQADPHHTTRRWHWLDPDTRDALFAAARRRGVTPAMALAASFSDVLAGWSADPRFLLNVPMFGREQRHPDVDSLVGDFTSSVLLDVDLGAAPTATARSRDAAGHLPRRRRSRGLSGTGGAPRPQSASRRTGAGPGRLHQRTGPWRAVRRCGDRGLRQAGVDQLARPAGASRRPGDGVRRRHPGQLGCSRGCVPARSRRRDVRPPHRRTAAPCLRRHCMGSAARAAHLRAAACCSRCREQQNRCAQRKLTARRILRLGRGPPGCAGRDQLIR